MFCIRQDSGQKDGRMYKLLTTLKIGYNLVPILAKKKKIYFSGFGRDEIKLNKWVYTYPVLRAYRIICVITLLFRVV